MIRLRDLGNSVIVVEHDEDAIQTADFIVDMGPAAGEHGGAVVAQGTPAEIRANPDSLTGLYLSGKRRIPAPAKRHALPEDHREIRSRTCHRNEVSESNKEEL